MGTDSLGSYRRRIYEHYVSKRDIPLAPKTLEGLTPRLPYLRHLVRQHFPREKTVSILDLGCGHGAMLYALREAGYHNLCGVDSSPEQVAAANRLGIEGVITGDAISTLNRFPDASYDVVVTFDLIEHFTKSEMVPFVDDVYRVLAPGGRWIIHAPNGESPFGGRIRYGDFTHEVAFTRLSVTQFLMASGFPEVACFEDRPVPHGVKSAVRALLWTGIRSMLLFYIAIETGSMDRRAIFSQNLLAVARKGV